MKTTVMNYRRGATLPVITSDDPRKGTIYLEFQETWTKKREGDKPARVNQKFTGRRFAFLERVVVKNGRDEDELSSRNFDHVICDPCDFSFLCLGLAKR